MLLLGGDGGEMAAFTLSTSLRLVPVHLLLDEQVAVTAEGVDCCWLQV
jgi:hypothetical protein